jgi:hypothetical protein
MSVRIGTVSTQVDTETAPAAPGRPVAPDHLAEKELGRTLDRLRRNARRTRATGFDEGFDD